MFCDKMSKSSAVQDPDLNRKMETFIRDLKENKINEPYEIAMQTLSIQRKIVAQCRWRNPEELISIIRDQGMKLREAQPSESIISNMTGRVLKLIRDEAKRLVSEGQTVVNEGDQEFFLQKLIKTEESGNVNLKQEVPNLKAAVIEAIGELLVELEAGMDNICSQALEHIHTSEIILTAGKSRTTENFLRKAAKKRKFQLIIVEGAPFYHGHGLAKRLADDSIETSVITDNQVFAIMSRVNKVLIGTDLVFADGGLKAPCGTFTIAQCAKYFSVPVVVCTSMYKFSQKHHCMEEFNKFASPQGILSYAEGEIISDVQVYNPVYDYVPPDLVTIYVTNIGGHATAYVYRLVQELYSTEDKDSV